MTSENLQVIGAAAFAALRAVGPLLAAAALVLVEPPRLVAAAEPAAVCKSRKGKTVGTYTLAVLKAFGKNARVPNGAGLAQDLSRAQAGITRGFTRAEYSGYFGDLGCEITGDVAAMEAKANAFAEDVLDEIPPP